MGQGRADDRKEEAHDAPTLPFAGITRIRFKGFFSPGSLSKRKTRTPR
ncbi:hypothetical protein AzCIB_3866 [Azoarcus sp. CIB]|nr:hypothetical protein AzCIB_3866 [Azoarcus sp. CIB]